MKENPWTKVRRVNIRKVFAIVKANQPVTNTKLLALIDLEIGNSNKTALSIIKTLQDSDMIKWDDKKKVWKIA